MRRYCYWSADNDGDLNLRSHRLRLALAVIWDCISFFEPADDRNEPMARYFYTLRLKEIKGIIYNMREKRPRNVPNSCETNKTTTLSCQSRWKQISCPLNYFPLSVFKWNEDQWTKNRRFRRKLESTNLSKQGQVLRV